MKLKHLQKKETGISSIHLKTLQFRRKRIQVILGLNPADIESRLYLATALRLRRLRGEMGQ